jgi:hypothetical protein
MRAHASLILSQSCSTSGRLFSLWREFMFPRGHSSCVLLFQRGFSPQSSTTFQQNLSSLSSLIQLSGTSYFRPAAQFPVSCTSRSILSFSLTVKDYKHVPFVLISIEHANVDVTNERSHFVVCRLRLARGRKVKVSIGHWP